MELTRRLSAYLQCIPFHPFLLATYPAVALLAHNIEQVRPPIALRAALVSVIGAGVLLLIFRIVIRDWDRAALASSFAILLFFTYGHVYEYLQTVTVGGFVLGRHRHLIPLWLLIFGIGLWQLLRRGQRNSSLTVGLNGVTALALIFPLFTLTTYEVRLNAAQQEAEQLEVGGCGLQTPEGGQAPDVYFIILDAYARQDVLEEVYELDNSEFLTALEELGFYVARWSQSNYIHTELSLTSSLNMDYLQSLDPIFASGGPPDLSYIWPLLGKSRARQTFECLGYKIVTFDSGYYWTGWRDVDVFLSKETGLIGDFERTGGINSFESMLLRTSGGSILSDLAVVYPDLLGTELDHPYREHRERMLYIFDALGLSVPSIPGPKFVFAHILLPHPPYVFGPNGEPIEQTTAFSLNEEGKVPARVGYPNQVRFTNSVLLEAVEQILAVSRTPPVIIIQGDHGHGRHERDKVSILNAYYLPGEVEGVLYESITPVNNFRLVFDLYFRGDYGLLEDKSYYSPYDATYDFSEVPFDRPGRGGP